MERKKWSKGSVWEFCYANNFFGTFGDEIRAYGQKLVKFCAHTHTHTHAAKLVVRLFVVCAITQTCLSYSFTTTVVGVNVATPKERTVIDSRPLWNYIVTYSRKYSSYSRTLCCRLCSFISWHRHCNGCQSCQEGVFPSLLHW